MKKIAITAALCALSFAAVPADQASAPASPSFTRADTNRDGYLSREEWRRVNGTDRVFDESDDNRDGRLDRDEHIKASSFMQRQRAAGFVDDSVLTAKVKAALVKEMRSLSVNVDTHQGNVLLSGFVDDEAQIRRAVQIASAVDGVSRVHNGMVAR